MGTKSNIIVSGKNIALYIDDTDVGFTHDGVVGERVKEFLDIEVDQSLCVIEKKIISDKCFVRFTVKESTLENIKIAMGENNSITDDGSWKRLSFGGGDTVPEHTLRFEGLAPGTSKTRKYWFFIAVSVDLSEIPYKKGEETMIPVTMEILADLTKAEDTQFGYYEDQI